LFATSVERQREASDAWLESLGEIDGAVERAGRHAASDALADQLASTQEVSRGSCSSSANCSTSCVRSARAKAKAAPPTESKMYPSEGGEAETSVPVFAAFSDLLACVLGIFVLFFIWVVSFEIHMAGELEHEREQRVHATDRLHELETALAGTLRQGLITFVDGTIGIRANVLFDLNSAQLRSQGSSLLRELAGPLASYLARAMKC